MNPIVNGNTSALLTALRGVQASESRAAEAASNLVEGLAAAANEVSTPVEEIANVNQEAVVPPAGELDEGALGAVLGEGGNAPDPLQALVDLKVEQYVHAANLAAAGVASDMEDSALERLV